MSGTVGMRELRQNLKAVMDRVRLGEHIVVTEHNRPVAAIGPVDETDLTPLERLYASGRVTPAAKGPPHDFDPSPLEGVAPNAASAALEKDRGER